jgi:phthalate 4,5-cis-dihydrodiol dehydrogenase
MTTVADKTRPVEGSYVVYLGFEDGTPATMSYNGYMHFDTSEITFGLGLLGVPANPDAVIRNRRQVMGFRQPEEEWAAKEALRYGGGEVKLPGMAHQLNPSLESQRRHPFYGLTLASCEKGDIRQSPEGLVVYGDDGIRRVPVPAGRHYFKQNTTTELDEMYEAWANDRPILLHDAYWGRATVEVITGILRSAAERREVFMRCQTPYRPPVFRW